MRRFPEDVLKKLNTISQQVVADVGKHDKLSTKIYQSFSAFRKNVIQWSAVSEQDYMRARELT